MRVPVKECEQKNPCGKETERIEVRLFAWHIGHVYIVYTKIDIENMHSLKMKAFVLKVVFREHPSSSMSTSTKIIGVYSSHEKALYAYNTYERSIKNTMRSEGNEKWISYELDCLEYEIEEFEVE